MTKFAPDEANSAVPAAGRQTSSKLTNAQMVKRSKENLIRDGGRVLNTLRLQPEAAAALARLENATQQSATFILNDLLVKAGRKLK